LSDCVGLPKRSPFGKCYASVCAVCLRIVYIRRSWFSDEWTDCELCNVNPLSSLSLLSKHTLSLFFLLCILPVRQKH